MAIQINTEVVAATAEQIDIINKTIRDELTNIDIAIRTLQQNWEGTAASSCVNKYEYIKKNFSDSRFSVVDGVVSFMRIQVGEGYEKTEKTVSSAASAFK